MYYRLNTAGRFIWTAIVFIIWCYLTWSLMRFTIVFGMDSGDALREWLRTAGFNPAISDFYKLGVALTGFFLIPILTTYSTIIINRKLKGSSHERQIEHRDVSLGRKRLPPPSGSLRAVPQQSLPAVSGRGSESETGGA